MQSVNAEEALLKTIRELRLVADEGKEITIKADTFGYDRLKKQVLSVCELKKAEHIATIQIDLSNGTIRLVLVNEKERGFTNGKSDKRI